MLLPKDVVAFHRETIDALCAEHLEYAFGNGSVFGVVENDLLIAFGSARCLHGHWYCRSDVVRPEFRGRGLQRQLIRERLAHLEDRASVLRVAIYPHNEHSIRNYLAEGFTYEKHRILPDGKPANIYRFDF